MADFAPPTGPPPPKVPPGWKAVFNAQYQEWFYVNLVTKQSQWDKPTEPVHGAESHDTPPPGGLPSEKHFASNNPYGPRGADLTEDEKLARQLQAEEDARGHGRPTSRGAADEFYGGGAPSPYRTGGGGSGYPPPAYGQPSGGYGGSIPTQSYDQQQLPPRPDEKKKGLLGKIMGGGKHGSSSQGYPQQGYGYPQQGQYGGYPPQQPMYAQQQPPKKHGMGMGGAAALGAGGGLLGGLALGEMMDGGDGGGDFGGDDGGDFGGDGGGDFGGDFGGD